MAKRPTLKDTSDWRTVYDSPIVTIESATLTIDGRSFRDGAFRVVVHEHENTYRRGPDGGFVRVAGSKKLFYGETAWMDAQRMAQDFDRAAVV